MARYRAQAIVLGVTVAITSATPTVAQTYRLAAADGTVHLTNAPTDPAYRRLAMTGAPASVSRGRWRQDAHASSHAYAREIAEAAARHAVPEGLIRAVIRVESGYDPRAVSRQGARGLMQLMPATAAMLGVRDSFNARENIDGGVRHLRALIERFGQDLHLAIAAYNAGEGAVVAHRGVPPYPETRAYVTRVLSLYRAAGDRTGMPAGTYRIVERDGTVLYTNIPAPGRWSGTGG